MIAACSKSDAEMISKLESFSIDSPFSLFVPLMTTTNGIFELVSLEALTIPVATTSALAIPANKFTNIISTSLSSIIILKAGIIFS